MRLYNKIKKEHLFIFLVLFTALVLFTYFDKDFNYTSLSTKEICTDKSYQCCNQDQGEGTNYFSLDYSCPSNQQCWSSCSEQVKETNLITSSAVLDSVWSPIKDFFINLFKKGPIAGIGTTECQGKNTLFTISGELGGSHASKEISGTNAYLVPICSTSNQFQKAQEQDSNNNKYLLIKLSEPTNAHVEKKELGNYNILIYIKPSTGNGNIICNYEESVGSECLFSISGDTNAHIGACQQNQENIPIYDKKIYCDITTTDGRGLRLTGDCENLRERRTISCNTNLQGICNVGTQTEECKENEIAQKVWTSVSNCIPNIQPRQKQEIPSNGLDDDCDGQVDETTENIQPLTQSDYEVFWANDGIVAFSFDKYKQRIGNQIQNIKNFKVYRKLLSVDSVFILINTINFKKDGSIIKGVYYAPDGSPTNYDINFDFWDTGLTDERVYQYKLVPVNAQDQEIPTNEFITVTPKATRAITVSGSCTGINYAQCSQTRPQYCGIENNLMQNNGFELDLNNWYQLSQQQFDIVNNINNHKGELSNVAHININQDHSNDIGLYQEVSVRNNSYYNVSMYIKTLNIPQNNKPLLEINCFKVLSDNQKRLYLNSVPISKEIEDTNAQWKLFSYIFKTYYGADKCRIVPAYFPPNAKGEVWIDGIRLENVTSNQFQLDNDCGICGCPTNAPYCQSNGECSSTNLCGNGVLNIGEPCDIVSGVANFGGKTCASEMPSKPYGELSCTSTCIIDITGCTAQTEDCTKPTGDADRDGIEALFDSYCATTLNNYISIVEVTTSKEQAYISTNIQISCNYEIKDSAGETKNLPQTQEQLIKDCIHAYIEPVDTLILCEETKATDKITRVSNNLIVFKKCNTGNDPNENTPVICEIDEKCASTGEPPGESFMSIIEYPYCTEISIGAIDFIENSIKLNSANNPGEELKISGKITAEPGTITIEAALVDLENDQILKETSTDINYESETYQQKSFELKFIIPPVTTKNYFIFVKAYVKNDEEGTCIQANKQLKVISDITEGENVETSCTNQIDDDNDELTDCEDDDCSTDPACLGQACQEGSSCNTNLPGICSIGTQRCLEDGSFGECTPRIQPGTRQEIPNNSFDENCDGQIDEGGIPTTADSDNDGLPDSWEYENFNTLVYGPNDDPDNDDISNIDEYRENTNPNVPEKKKINLTWLWIILGIIITIILIFILFKFLRKPRARAGSSSYADPRLSSYIQDSLRKGFTKQQIKQALISKGWSPRDIDNALR